MAKLVHRILDNDAVLAELLRRGVPILESKEAAEAAPGYIAFYNERIEEIACGMDFGSPPKS